MYHNTFKVAELVMDKLYDRLGLRKENRIVRAAAIEEGLRRAGSISCKSDGKEFEIELHQSSLVMCVYLMALAEEIAVDLSMKDYELLKILAEVDETLDKGELK